MSYTNSRSEDGSILVDNAKFSESGNAEVIVNEGSMPMVCLDDDDDLGEQNKEILGSKPKENRVVDLAKVTDLEKG